MKPIYNKDMTKRVVFERNGTFVAQKRVPGQGTKTFDPWEPIQRPTTNLELAKRQAGIEVEKVS